MAETGQLALPLIAPAQAQKHVMVNEAFARLDGLVPVVIAARDLAVPPLNAEEGAVYAVPAGGDGLWAGQEGRLAIASNGGWIFVTPRRGWRGFLLAEGRPALHDGSDWIAGALSMGPGGAATCIGLSEVTHVLGSGTGETLAGFIPPQVLVLGITARVLSAIGGTATGWAIGNPGAETRFGSGLGLTEGSWGRGILGQPTAFYSAEDLVLTPEGGTFDGGTVRLALHYFELGLPSG